MLTAVILCGTAGLKQEEQTGDIKKNIYSKSITINVSDDRIYFKGFKPDLHI